LIATRVIARSPDLDVRIPLPDGCEKKDTGNIMRSVVTIEGVCHAIKKIQADLVRGTA
jgi:hypothetical protein